MITDFKTRVAARRDELVQVIDETENSTGKPIPGAEHKTKYEVALFADGCDPQVERQAAWEALGRYTIPHPTFNEVFIRAPHIQLAVPTNYEHNMTVTRIDNRPILQIIEQHKGIPWKMEDTLPDSPTWYIAHAQDPLEDNLSIGLFSFPNSAQAEAASESILRRTGRWIEFCKVDQWPAVEQEREWD